MRLCWLLAGALYAGAVSAAELVLPCPGPDGQPVAGTVVRAIREDFSGAMLNGEGRDGRCRIELPAGVFWVKAEAPGMRSVGLRAADGAAPGRELRLHPTSGSDAAAQQRLQQMVERDQAVRRAYDEARAQPQDEAGKAGVAQADKAMQELDERHQAELRRWLAERGFPRAAEVGYGGVAAFWLMLQHAPDLIEAQLPALRAAVAAGELPRPDLALSEDRIRMTRGLPQRYGSQLQRGEDGKLQLYTLESAEQVDAWRAEMDLEPLAVYLKRFDR